MPAQWLIGVLLCVAGAAFTNLGLSLQKLSFIRIDALQLPPHKKPSFFQPLWVAGFFIFLVGQVGGMIAMGFSSQSVVATLGSFSLVTNAIFAPLLLGEQLTWTLVVSIVVIIAGSVIVVLSSNHTNQDYTLQQLLDLFHHDLFTAYATVLAVCLLLCVAQMVREHRRHAREQRLLNGGEGDSEDASEGREDVVVPMVDDSMGGLSINTSVSLSPTPNKPLLSPSTSFDGSTHSPLDLSPLSPAHSHTPPLTSASAPTLSSFTPTLTAAILSSISVLLGKCTMQLIKTSATTPDNQFTSPVSYLITAVFLTAAIASVHLLNVGLRRGTALFVVPFYYVASTSLAIGGGLVYFEEFSAMGWLQCTVFFGGVGLTVLGVWISTRGQMEEEEREREEEEVEEELDAEAMEAEAQMQADEDDASKTVEGDEHKSSQASPRYMPPALPLSSSASPASPASRTQASPRGAFTPRHSVITEEESITTPEPRPASAALKVDEDAEAEEEERESAKRRQWQSKRAVSEPGLSFVLPSPLHVKGEQPPVEQYGTFTSSSTTASATTPSSASPSHVSTALTRATMSSAAARLGRTQSLSLALGDVTSHSAVPLSRRHELTRSHTTRSSAARRSYTPHYTLAWYPVLPSNPAIATARRKQRSVSVAGSRHLSPSGSPATRRLNL